MKLSDLLFNFIENLFNGEINFYGLSLLKIALLVVLFFYFFYAVLVAKQVYLMNRFLETRLSPWAKIIAIIHLIYTVFVILLILFFI